MSHRRHPSARLGLLLIAIAVFPTTADAASLDEQAMQVVNRFDYTNIKDVADEGAFTVVRRSFKPGVHSGWHPYKMANPNPAWLPGWEMIQKRRLDDRAWSALIQARINQTWTAKCHEDFADYAKRWKALAASLEPELQALEAETNVYRVVPAARALVDKLIKGANADKLWLDAKSRYRHTGPYYDVMARVANALRHAMIPNANVIPDWAAKGLAEHGRSWGPEAQERSLFCGELVDYGTHRTYKAWRIYQDPMVAKVVAWPTAPAELARLTTEAYSHPKAPGFAGRFLRSRSLGGFREPEVRGDFPSTPAEREAVEKLRYFQGPPVVKVGRDKIVLKGANTNLFDYDCRETNKVDRIDRRGRVVYRERCKTGQHRHTVVITLAVSQLPPGLELKKGDVLHGYMLLDSGTEATQSASKRRGRSKSTFKGRLHYLTSVERGGKDLL